MKYSFKNLYFDLCHEINIANLYSESNFLQVFINGSSSKAAFFRVSLESALQWVTYKILSFILENILAVNINQISSSGFSNVNNKNQFSA